MSRKIKDLFATDWEAELEEGEKVTRKDGNESLDVVVLAGLQRLSRLAGIYSQGCVIQTPSSSMVQAIFTTSFHLSDGGDVHFVGTADCNAGNTGPKFAKYPTAVAESRAEARSLRKALGIRMLSSEEIGFREGVSSLEATPGGKAASQLITAIELLLKNKEVEVVTALEGALGEDRAAEIFELNEVSTTEAQQLMSWLNDSKAATKKKKLTKKEERDARKKELTK